MGGGFQEDSKKFKEEVEVVDAVNDEEEAEEEIVSILSGLGSSVLQQGIIGGRFGYD